MKMLNRNNEPTFRVNEEFTDGEMWALTSALSKFMYDNPNLTEEQYELANSARDKLLKDVI